MEQFPILRLPFVAIEEVMSTWSPFEIINFSTISRLTNALTKSFTKFNAHHNYDIELLILNNLEILMRGTDKYYSYKITEDSTKNDEKTCENEYETVETVEKFSRNKIDGFKKWYERVKEIFGCNIFSVLHAMYNFSQIQNESIIDWLKTQSDSIEVLEILGDKSQQEISKYAVENLKISYCLQIFIDNDDDFSMELPEKIEDLHLEDGRFVTLEKLKKMQSARIRIRKNRLSNQEISQFLNFWIDSESKLENFEIRIENEMALEEILMDVVHEETGEDRMQVLSRRGYDTIKPQQAWDIFRSDGTKATIFKYIHLNDVNLIMLVL